MAWSQGALGSAAHSGGTHCQGQRDQRHWGCQVTPPSEGGAWPGDPRGLGGRGLRHFWGLRVAEKPHRALESLGDLRTCAKCGTRRSVVMWWARKGGRGHRGTTGAETPRAQGLCWHWCCGHHGENREPSGGDGHSGQGKKLHTEHCRPREEPGGWGRGPWAVGPHLCVLAPQPLPALLRCCHLPPLPLLARPPPLQLFTQLLWVCVKQKTSLNTCTQALSPWGQASRSGLGSPVPERC